ncbi:glycoside hydrolase family 16 protein [Flavobacteriales bacterium]|nr:glycoside hydrolase family 16 protein [Flavobacteriales bacterium]
MKNLLIVLVSVVLFSCEQTQYNDLEYQLVWSDEFDQGEIDERKWNFEIGNGCQYNLYGWGNNELEYYTAQNASISESDYLLIEAKKEQYQYEDCDGTVAIAEYTSARLNTKNKFDFSFGKVEASIKMDVHNGIWHAFWMLPSFPQTYWPLSGEIDIMEQFRQSNQNKLITTVHFGYGMIGAEYDSLTPTYFDEFHTYGVEWDRVSIKWFIDDSLVHTVYKTENQDLETTWPFNDPFHLILNTAVGGNLGGTPSFDSTKTMLVDYVRVYQKTTEQ